MRKHVVRNPATLAQTIRRRILLTGESSVLSTTAPGAFETDFIGGATAGLAGAAVRAGNPPGAVS